MNRRVGIGLQESRAVLSFHRDDQKGARAEAFDALDRQAGAAAPRFDRRHLDVEAKPLEVERETVEIAAARPRNQPRHVLMQQELGDAFGADPGGQDDAIGPRLKQFALGRGQFAARDDRQVAIEAPRAQGDEDIGGVVGQHGREGAGAGDARLPHDILVGRVPLDEMQAGLARRADALLGMVDDDETGAAGLQFMTQHLSDPAEAADDDVIGELVDVLLHAARSQNLLNLAGGDQLEHAAGQEDHARAADDDQSLGNGAKSRRVDRMNLAIADGIDRQHHHIERVARAPPLRHIGERADRRHDQHEGDDGDEIAQGGGEERLHDLPCSGPRTVSGVL